MAALSDASMPSTWELRKLRPGQLDPILSEETTSWQEALDWDFHPSADLVRRFVRMKALSGYGLIVGGDLAGYAYYVIEESKGLIGDLYVLRRFRCQDYENRLLGACLDALFSTPYVARVEAQVMMLPAPFERRVPSAEYLRTYPRDFMVLDMSEHGVPPAGPAAGRVRIHPWSNSIQEDAARLIAEAYKGHVDSQINDQYRSVSGARRFLLNIVQYPGCGSFFAAGSFLASDPDTGAVCGLCLSSLVSADVGHVTQICTTPAARGTGVGYELLRRALQGLVDQGCRKVSLTVTAENHEAIRLYERVGFELDHCFAAYVWEGF